MAHKIGGPPPSDHPRRCTATSKRSREQCRGWAMEGTNPPRCKSHVGKSVERVRREADEQRAVAAAQRMVARAGVEQSPIEHLLDSLHLAAQLVAVWGSMVADLDNAGELQVHPEHGEVGRLRGEISEKGAERYRLVPDADRLMAVSSDGVARVHPYVEQYERWLDRRAKYAALAIRAGVEERLVRIREREAEQLVEALDAAMGSTAVAEALGIDTMPHAARTAARRELAETLRRLHEESAVVEVGR